MGGWPPVRFGDAKPKWLEPVGDVRRLAEGEYEPDRKNPHDLGPKPRDPAVRGTRYLRDVRDAAA